VSELKAGALDAIFVEKPIAEAYIKNNRNSQLRAASSSTRKPPVTSLACPKDSAELKDAINATIKRLATATRLLRTPKKRRTFRIRRYELTPASNKPRCKQRPDTPRALSYCIKPLC
jgi:16S rRNA G1207 methylase RsmC